MRNFICRLGQELCVGYFIIDLTQDAVQMRHKTLFLMHSGNWILLDRWKSFGIQQNLNTEAIIGKVNWWTFWDPPKNQSLPPILFSRLRSITSWYMFVTVNVSFNAYACHKVHFVAKFIWSRTYIPKSSRHEVTFHQLGINSFSSLE